MNAPARTEGPPIYGGRSYDAVAHRAMDVRAFVAIDLALREAGIRAPEILAADMEPGLLLLEDLGGEGIVDPSGAPILERYEAAIDLLAYMHGRDWPAEAPLPDGTLFRLPPYDRDALLVEISLFPDWFGGHGGEPAFPEGSARRISRGVVEAARRDRQPELDLDAARFPFAEHPLAGRARAASPASASSISRTR